MAKDCILEITDEANIRFKGLDVTTRRKLTNTVKFFQQTARHTPAFKLGRWDGCVRFCDIGGRSYIHLLDKLLPIVQDAGYLIEIDDRRKKYTFDFEQVDANSYSHVKWPEGHVHEGEPVVLRDHQVRVVNKYIENLQSIQSVSTGAGKSQPLYSKVKVPGGWKTMGEITVGDVVTAADGTNSNVIGVYPQGKQPVYEFTFSDGRKTRAAGDHLWDTTTKTQYGKWFTRTTNEIIEYHRTKKQSLYIPLCSTSVSNEADLPLDPYLLGILLGDGSFRNNHVGVSTSDKEVIDYISNVLHEDYYVKKLKGVYDYSINIKPEKFNSLRQDAKWLTEPFHYYRKEIIKMGLDHKLSHEKFVPEVYKFANAEQRTSVLSGLLDSDGWVDKSSAVFTSTSEQLANDVMYLARSLGLKSSIKNCGESPYTYNGEKKKGRISYDVRVMGDIKHLFNIGRKRDRVKESTKSVRPYIKIVDIEYIGEENCQCIMIDHPDHLYVTDDFVVTHNTIITAIMAHKVEPYGRSLTIVPSVDLVTQTETDFKNFGLDVGVYYGDRKEPGHKHTICTWQSIESLDKKSKNYDPELHIDDFVEGTIAIIVDESHGAKAEVLKKHLTSTFAHCPLRWGMTGTIPLEESDQVALTVGLGPVVNKVTAKELQDLGILSRLEIEVIQLNDGHVHHDSYASELKYLVTDLTRLKWLAAHIEEQRQEGNTLVLVDRIATGELLLEMIPNSVFISGGVKSKDRKEHYSSIKTAENEVTIATYGVAAVGIDIPRIFNLYLVEPGKSFIRVIQSIGRGIRKAKDKDFVNIFDITSTAKFSKKHLTERKKFYKSVEYPFKIKKVKYLD